MSEIYTVVVYQPGVPLPRIVKRLPSKEIAERYAADKRRDFPAYRIEVVHGEYVASNPAATKPDPYVPPTIA